MNDGHKNQSSSINHSVTIAVTVIFPSLSSSIIRK